MPVGCQDLPFYCCPWFIPNVKFAQFDSPLHQPSKGLWFMVYAVFASLDIRLGLRRCELGSKVGVSWMWLPMPGSAFPSLVTFLLPPLKLGYNSRLVATPCPVLLPGQH